MMSSSFFENVLEVAQAQAQAQALSLESPDDPLHSLRMLAAHAELEQYGKLRGSV